MPGPAWPLSSSEQGWALAVGVPLPMPWTDGKEALHPGPHMPLRLQD